MKNLTEFNNDKELRNAVHEYLVEYMKEEAVRTLFDRENTETYMNPDTIADAKELVDKAFENLDVIYNPQAKKRSLRNEAR
jgi:hypothetical protein